MKQFNTSGPNIFKKHYTLNRSFYLEQGVKLVTDDRYFTIWAPRQTGKSTYFRQLAETLKGMDYKVVHINFENYKNRSLESFMDRFRISVSKGWGLDVAGMDMAQVFLSIEQINDRKMVLIIDEVEGINAEYFGDFLHSIRNAYHSRTEHALKSVILVGVTNIVGVVQDNASPFNIAENLNLPYFTEAETFELLKMHEDETGQLFEQKVKEKIYDITAGQPGLVNGFANQLVRRYPDEKLLNMEQYLIAEDWYLTEAIDKNVMNIINKASDFRPIVERLLFTENQIHFDIDRESVKILHTNGIIRKNEDKNIEFWVPLYKKRLYKAFYPYTNGEGKRIGSEVVISQYFDTNGKLKLDTLIQNFKNYVNRRGFDVFREKSGEEDTFGNPVYKSIPEAAMIYAFETYIQATLLELDGKSYREANAALGRTDLLIQVRNEELLIESKVFSSASLFQKGKKQLAYYCKHLGLTQGIYLVFIAEHLLGIHKETTFEDVEIIEGVDIRIYLVTYEEDMPEYRKAKTKKRLATKKK